jgi:hypothetical protein
MRALDTETVIARARAKHGDVYDYVKFVYVNKRTKGIIICRKHGDFEQLPLDHAVRGYGCGICGYEVTRKFTLDEFVEKARQVHGDKYDYKDSLYLGSQKMITIRCHIHGPFTQVADSHLQGTGCPPCGYARGGLKGRLSQDEFIHRCKQVHGEKYNYNETVYSRSTDLITVLCPKHGPFTQSASAHLVGHGCQKCGVAAVTDYRRLTTKQFVAACVLKRGDKYSYDKVQYVDSNTDVVITCSTHGDFKQNPANHLHNIADCPKCTRGRFSKVAIEWLQYRSRQDGVYIQHAMNAGEMTVQLPNGKRMKFDGYSAETNTVYEFWGDFFHGNPKCYEPDYVNPVNKRKMGDLWRETCERSDATLELGYNLTTIWENEWRALCKAKFFD